MPHHTWMANLNYMITSSTWRICSRQVLCTVDFFISLWAVRKDLRGQWDKEHNMDMRLYFPMSNERMQLRCELMTCHV